MTTRPSNEKGSAPLGSKGADGPTDAEWLEMAAAIHPFDLETRSLLAMHGMMGTTAYDRGVPYFLTHLWPAYPLTDPGPMLVGEYLDGMTMARIVSGGSLGLKTEKILRKSICEVLVDGLGDTAGGAFIGEEAARGQTEVAGHKHLLPALLNLYRLFPDDPRPLNLMRQSLQKFYDIALRGHLEDGRPYIYYPVSNAEEGPGAWSYIMYHRTEGWGNGTREPIDTGSAGFEGAITLPFAQYYELTRESLAEEFLEQFIVFLLERATDFNPDGSFTKTDCVNGQVWSRLMTTEGILIYGLASGRADLVAWARNVFDKALELHGTRFGWLPENLSFGHGQGCETDTMTAQLEIALLLARNVDDAYWEVAERIAMNQLLAQQLLRVDFVGNTMHLLGGFHSFCAPNDWWNPEGLYITQSSHGSGMRALYNVWYHAAWWEAGETGRTLRVNLHWSKNLPGARIISHLPSATILEVYLEEACRLVVRKPDWADAESIRADIRLSGGPSCAVPIMLRGRWMHLGHFDAGSCVVLRFRDEVVTHEDVIHNRASESEVIYAYTTRWRGNAVLSIEPDGKMQPNYAGRERPGLGPYVPQHTALEALDPIAMTPVEYTVGLRARSASVDL